MLVAHGRLRIAPVALDFDVVLEREFRVLSVRREATLFDARFAPPNGGQAEGHVVHVLLEGAIEWHDPGGRILEAGALHVAPLSHVEGTQGRRLRTFRTTGSPFVAVELQLASAELVDPPLERTVIPSAPGVVDAARTWAELVHADLPVPRPVREAALGELLHVLQREGILARDLASTVRADEGVHGKVWEALAPFVERMALSPSLAAMSERTGFSAGQLDRRVGEFLRTLRIPWPGWRDVTRGLRLRVAVLLLSNPEIALGEVARRSGYSSPEALSHALTTEGLPPPLELRRKVLAG